MCSDPEDPTPECEGGGRPSPSPSTGGGGSGSKGKSKQPQPDLCKMYRECDPTALEQVDYIIGDEITLSSEEVQLLLHEIDWWLGFLEPIDSFLTYWAPILEGVGVFSVAALIMVSFGAPVFATGAVLGAIALLADWTVSATINDLQDFRYTIAMESSGGKVPISIEYGSNVVNWGVTVNGNKQKEISHWNTHPILNAKGVLNLFPAFFITETIYQGWD